MNLVDTARLFSELDHLIANRIFQLKCLNRDIKEALEFNEIPLSLPIRERLKGEEGEITMIGESLINSLEIMSKFLNEYKEIKDTWHVTIA